MTRLITHPILAHLAAMAAALFFAWHVSQSPLARSGVQFIAPLLVIMAVHLVWLAWPGHLTKGCALRIYGRSALTGVLMIVLLFAGSILAPAPAQADVGDVMGEIFTVVFCVFIIAVIIGAAGFIIWAFFRIVFWLIGRKKRPDDPSDRLNDGASLIAVSLLLALASAEGISDSLTFDTTNAATAEFTIDAPADRVWAVMQTATSPDFPLPAILASLPQPVAVPTDEGTDPGALRVVAFAGREGAGTLRLRVSERTPTTAVFDVISDTTPYRSWISYQRLVYEVIPDGDQTQLTVTLHYERRLSPAWFFEPAMEGAGTLAMRVLGRDVKTRAEAI